MKFGSLKKGWVFSIKLYNPDIWRFRKSGRIRFLNILGVITFHWVVRRKRGR